MSAWLCLLASLASAGMLRELPGLPPSLLEGAPPIPDAAHQPVCERKPVVAEVPLPGPRAYFRSPLVFQSEGMTVHVAGSKDRRQKYGYYLAFTVDGDDQPVWVRMGLGTKHFQLRGRPYSVETKLSLLHHERIELLVRREGDPAVVCDFTVGELAERVQAAGPSFRLLGRDYHATYVEDIREGDGRAQILSDQHTVLVTTYDTYRYDNGRVGYKFWQQPMQAETLRGAGMYSRPMGVQASGPRGRVPVVYGFHLTSRNTLQVYDLTDYQRGGVPACPPID